MSIRKRTWQTESGEERTAYVVQYSTAEKDKRGKRTRHIKTFDRKKDAEDFQAQVRVDLKKGVHTPASKSITIEEAGKNWIDSCGDLERTTIEQYQQHLNFHILPYLGGLKLSALSIGVVRNWQDRLRKEGRSAVMVKKTTTSLSSLLTDAMERTHVAQNVVRSMTASRRKRSKVERRAKRKLKVGVDIPTPAEIDALLEHTTSDRWRAFFLVAIRCGLRASELRGLRWQDIDFKNKKLHVRQRADNRGVIGSPKSAAGERTIPIPPNHTLAALRTWKLQSPKQHFVFPNGSGHVEMHGNIIDRALKPAWERAGVTGRYSGLHALRHYFASWCLARPPVGLGLSLKELSERLGHESVSTTEIYTHLIDRPDHSKELAAAEGRFG
jgi:integrase